MDSGRVMSLPCHTYKPKVRINLEIQWHRSYSQDVQEVQQQRMKLSDVGSLAHASPKLHAIQSRQRTVSIEHCLGGKSPTACLLRYYCRGLDMRRWHILRQSLPLLVYMSLLGVLHNCTVRFDTLHGRYLLGETSLCCSGCRHN